MPWVKLDTHFWTHPKVLEVGFELAVKHQMAMCWSAEHSTGGIIPKQVLSQFGLNLRGVNRLVRAKLWDNFGETSGKVSGNIGETSWKIHDWNTYNPDAEQAKRDRDDWETNRLEMRAKAREKKRAQRAKERDLSPDVSPGQSPGRPQGPSRDAREYVPSRPVTSLDSDGERERKSSDSDSSSGTQNHSTNGSSQDAPIVALVGRLAEMSQAKRIG